MMFYICYCLRWNAKDSHQQLLRCYHYYVILFHDSPFATECDCQTGNETAKHYVVKSPMYLSKVNKRLKKFTSTTFNIQRSKTTAPILNLFRLWETIVRTRRAYYKRSFKTLKVVFSSPPRTILFLTTTLNEQILRCVSQETSIFEVSTVI